LSAVKNIVKQPKGGRKDLKPHKKNSKLVLSTTFSHYVRRFQKTSAFLRKKARGLWFTRLSKVYINYRVSIGN